jgi:hypothetical protein
MRATIEKAQSTASPLSVVVSRPRSTTTTCQPLRAASSQGYVLGLACGVLERIRAAPQVRGHAVGQIVSVVEEAAEDRRSLA